MKFVSYKIAGMSRYGLVSGNDVFDLSDRVGGRHADLKSFIAAPEWRQVAEQALASGRPDHSYGALTLQPVIPNPEKIICVAHNYREAARGAGAEGAQEPPGHPACFARFPDSLVGHRTDIVRPRISVRLDYGAQLLAVIGRTTPKYVRRKDALKYVFGYSALNGGSVDDYLHHSSQLTAAHNFLSSGSCGPWIVTSDEIPDPQSLDLEFRLNGERMQHANTRNMIFGVAELIAYITQWLPLKPGDLIGTGTMSGGGGGRDPAVFLQPGDRTEVVVSGVGTLSNSVRDE